MERAILITGGAGYIGSHMCRLLAREGWTPVTLDNLSHGHRWAVQWGALEVGDLLDRPFLDGVFKRYRFEAVMHFASYSLVGESYQSPGKYYASNIQGALNLLEAMVAHGVNRLVFSSTCSTYGEPHYSPMDEEHPQWPINPYGWSKLMVERMMVDFHKAHGLDTVAMRYFNAAGADPEGRVGEWHQPETHLIPLVLQVALEERDAITVLGRDYDTPDGTCIRDYIHVDDLADAHLKALVWLKDQKGFFPFNLGNGAGYSVLQVINAAQRVTSRPIKVLDGARRLGDPPLLVGDAKRAREILGWSPALPELEEIMETAWRWIRKGPSV